MNYPFSNEIKHLKEEYKEMIDTMPDDGYAEMQAEDEATKFYGYDSKDEQFDDENLPF